MADREVERWITVNGARVPIFKGQTADEAVREAITGRKAPKSGKLIDKPTNKLTDAEKKKLAEEQLKKNPNDQLAKRMLKQTETQKQISKDQDEKERQIANNKKEADRADESSSTKSNTDMIYERYKDKIDAEAEKFREKWGSFYDDDKLERELATMKAINEKPYATTDTVAKQFALQKEYDMRQKVDEIAERYVTSNPVSGRWDTETAHQQNAIAKELGISKEAAKNIMIKRLGFSKDDFK